MTSAPTASIVIVSWNGRQYLEPCLNAVAAQQGVEAETILVDNGSSDGTTAFVRERFPWVRLVALSENRGFAGGNNAGAREARGRFIVLLNNDTVPEPGWLAALVRGLRDADLVQGMTLPDPAQTHLDGPFSRTMEVRAETGYYQTCNMGYRREALEQVGGFDERFRRPSGEDTDLAWRLKERGSRSVFVEDALVFHDVRPSNIKTHILDTWRWGDCVLTVREHPHLRDLLHRKWFFRQTHPPAILAGAGLVAMLRPGASPTARAAGLALLVPYVDMRVRRHPLRGRRRTRLLAIPPALVADLVEVGVMVVASVRYRTFVL